MKQLKELMENKPKRTGKTRVQFEVWFRDGANPTYLLPEDFKSVDFGRYTPTMIRTFLQYELSDGYWESDE